MHKYYTVDVQPEIEQTEPAISSCIGFEAELAVGWATSMQLDGCWHISFEITHSQTHGCDGINVTC
eukprot:SAG11_NODE_10507_length_825_cov_32.739669_1_plen_66_part_00